MYLGKNVGLEILDIYCNGFFGRRYDLSGSKIVAEAELWIVIEFRFKTDLNFGFAEFETEFEKENYIYEWTKDD